MAIIISSAVNLLSNVGIDMGKFVKVFLRFAALVHERK